MEKEKQFDIDFYTNSNGEKPVRKFLKDLRVNIKTDKKSRILFNKTMAYIDKLCEEGTIIGEPFVKKLDDEIWELRPLNLRILFVNHEGKIYLLLHHFIKTTDKTPPHELNQAKRNFKDHKERNTKHE